MTESPDSAALGTAVTARPGRTLCALPSLLPSTSPSAPSITVDANGEGKASVTLTLPAACDEEESVQAALSGLMVYLIGLREEYPDYLDVLEV